MYTLLRLLTYLGCVLLYLPYAAGQQATSSTIDMHVHALFKPYYSQIYGKKNVDIWNRIEHNCEESALKLLPKINGRGYTFYSQANLKEMLKGGSQLACQVLYPIERNYFRSGFYDKKNVLPFLDCWMGAALSPRIIMDVERDYFRDFVYQLRYILSLQEERPIIEGRQYTFNVLRKGEELDELRNNETAIGAVLAVEGAHTLGKASFIEKNQPHEAPEFLYKTSVLRNVERLKGMTPLVDGSEHFLRYPIFYMKFSTPFWNGLAGQTRAWSQKYHENFSMPFGIDEGLTPLGQEVIRKLIDKREGYRVLLDVTGMSVAARKWYYTLVGTSRYHGDTIPVLATAASISGMSWDKSGYDYAASGSIYMDSDTPEKNEAYYLNHWQRSLSMEDIQAIHESGGLIALSLDRRHLGGFLAKEYIEKTIKNTEYRRRAYAELLILNMLKVVEILQEPTAWDLLSIGGNFDGIMMPAEGYVTAADYTLLRGDLLRFFEAPTDLMGGKYTAEEVEVLMYGRSAAHLVDGIMGGNAYRFIKKHLGVGFEEEATIKNVKAEKGTTLKFSQH